MAEASLPPVSSPIVVPSDAVPTVLNGAALNGAVLGAVVGGNGNAGALGAITGGLLGGLIGKDAMEQQYRQGRVVRPPRSLGVTATFSAIAYAALIVLTAGVVFAVASPVALTALALGGAILGATVGVISHANRQRDYENAQNYYMRHGGSYEGRAREALKGSQVTPEDMQLLQDRLAAGKDRSFTRQVEEAGIGPLAQR